MFVSLLGYLQRILLLANLPSFVDRSIFALLAVFLISSCNQQKLSHLEEIQKRGVLKIITRNSPT
jgi:hypothetical protein